MKKALSILLVSMMAMSMSACGNESASSSSSKAEESSNAEETVTEAPVEENPTEAESSDGEETPSGDTVGAVLYADFEKIVGEDASKSAEDIANAVIADPNIEFMPMVMPIEEGLLTGFGNEEIKGFSEGAVFSPAIGSIPFVGYIFKLDDGSDVNAFMDTLKSSADPRWNICTEAEETTCKNIGNTVFFLMSPASFNFE